MNTRYLAGSVAKSFTHGAVLALEHAGRLSRQDALARFVPDFPNAANITIQQLIDHRAGITRDLPLGADATRVLSLDELARRIAALPVAAAPGERDLYSNNGYRLLALVIERASGEDYGRFVHEAVFEPRHMRDTIELRRGQTAPRVARGYIAGPGLGTLQAPPDVELLNHRGASSFYSTPSDLLKFARSLPLDPSELQEAVPEGQRRKLGHDGLAFGFANLCYRYPDQDAYVIMTCNIETPIFLPLHGDLEKFLFGEAVTPPAAPPASLAPFDAARAALFVGQYELFPGNPLVIRQQGESLWVSAGGDNFQPLSPLGGDRYFFRQKYAYLDFHVVDGQTQSVDWREYDRVFPLRKLS